MDSAIITLEQALEAIRALWERIEVLERRVKSLEAENAALRKENAALKARLLPDPATPSGAVPVYKKPGGKKRAKKPGRKAGHKGARREEPENVAYSEEHVLPTTTWPSRKSVLRW